MCKESEQESTSVSSVPGWVTNASRQLVDQASDLASRPYEAYGGPRVASFTGDQQSAFQSLRDLVARGDIPGGAREFAGAPASTISTERIVDEDGRLGAMSDYLNPYVEQALQPAIRKIMEAADAQRKRIGANATMAGAFGDARHGIVESDLDQNTSTAIGDTASTFMRGAFDAAMGQRGQDLARFLDVDRTNAAATETALQRRLTGAQAEQQILLQQIQALLAGGNQQQGLDQARLDADYQENIRGYQHQFTVLDALREALSSGAYDRTQTSTSVTPDNSGIGALGSIAGSVLSSAPVATRIASLI